MLNKAIVHIMTKSRMTSEAFTAEIDAIEELSECSGIKNIIFYKGEPIKYADLIVKLEKFGIFVQNYSNKEDLKEKVTEYSKEHDIVFISTPLELLVNVVNEVNLHLGKSITDNPDIFRNKYLQRELIQNYNPELGIKFIKGTVDDLDIKEIEKRIGYPFIIKPVDGLQSSGVAKITNKKEYEKYILDYSDFHDRLKERGIDTKDLIIEDFINGKLYSIDYFVSDKGEITLSKPVKVRLGIDVNVDDYSNIARIATEKTEAEFKGKRLKTFVNSTVKACGIRNTFVHHEFKINLKGQLKTIELNGRVGGGRLALMKRAYDLNLYKMLCEGEYKVGKLKENNIVVNIYATKRGMLKAFNNNILAKIKRRKSVYSIELEETFLGKEVGLTKDGFIKVGAIKLANKDYAEISKDFKYIKSKYSELLFIDKFKDEVNARRVSLFRKVRDYLNK